MNLCFNPLQMTWQSTRAKVSCISVMTPFRKNHPVTDPIPEHLMPYVTEQNPNLYTAIDHASWRFIMHVSKAYFKDHAHQKYLDGLRETGISTERIPLISEMDSCLRRFGWRAVAVVGFIPPAIFLEFQSLGVLVIGCDMRQLDHLAYTPAPDIVHEAAGHAPIVADPEYRHYLRNYGEVARNAIFSKHDIDIYEAIRDLSDVKEDPKSTVEMIAASQARLDKALAESDHVSEAAQLSRMAWWTIEYGLIGNSKKRLIYGAGLLSSVSESYHCLSDQVAKLPLTVDCVDMGYDITRPQPQLYVTENFETLTRVLDEFADRMAFKRGGLEALEKAKQAAICTTTVLDSGLQISSTLASIKKDEKGNLAYLQYQGPSQLSFHDKELDGHGAKYHNLGFGTPIGLIRLHDGRTVPASQITEKDLSALGFKSGQSSQLTFTSGVQVEGELIKTLEKEGKTLVLTFQKCIVRWKVGGKEEILFQPDWGTFDMACGTNVTSTFGGAADRTPYMKDTGGYRQRPASQKTNRTETNKALEQLYLQVRQIREDQSAKAQTEKLAKIQTELEQKYPQDWLLRLELLELDQKFGLKSAWVQSVKKQLDLISQSSNEKAELIKRGLNIWT